MKAEVESTGASCGTGILTPKKKERQTNMELLRVVSMLFVLVLHADYMALGAPKQPDLIDFPVQSALRVLVEHLAIVAVNVFVLISGWFGVRPKWKGLAGLLFQVFCLSFFVVAFFYVMGLPVSVTSLLKTLYVGSEHWFVVAYLGLYAMAPMLNIFVDHASKRQFRTFLVGFFVIEFFYGFMIDFGHFSCGYSMLSFIGLYLLARYLRLYPNCLATLNAKTLLVLYFITMLISSTLFLLLLHFGYSESRLIAYNSPFVICGSVFLLLLFSQLRLQSRFVNWLAASCFSIYLIHVHPLVFPYYKAFFKDLYDVYSGVSYLTMAVICLLGVGIGCILVDQLRLLCWKYLLFPVLDKRIMPIFRRISSCLM